MNHFVRWMRFNAVGALGMAVQLCALAGFNCLFGGRYLWASAAAIELTLLHNFVWHVRYTWRDRPDRFGVRRQLMRFHLSNGLVSLVGNVLLMRTLVQSVHLPVLIANALAIVCCSVLNFWLGNRWAFATSTLQPTPHDCCGDVDSQTFVPRATW